MCEITVCILCGPKVLDLTCCHGHYFEMEKIKNKMVISNLQHSPTIVEGLERVREREREKVGKVMRKDMRVKGGKNTWCPTLILMLLTKKKIK